MLKTRAFHLLCDSRLEASLVGATLLALGCTGQIGAAGGEERASTNVGPHGGGTENSSGPGAGATCNGLDPGPSYIRRVTRLEYDNTLRDLLGETGDPASTFPEEEKGLGFNNNAASLSVSPVLAEQYMAVAEKVATNAVGTNLDRIVPCSPTKIGIDACGQQFIAAFAKKAYRGLVDSDDIATLTSVFDIGKATDFATGVRLVVETALQAPQFLYRVEFGLPPQKGDPTVQASVDGAPRTLPIVRLTSWEMATRLSYQLWSTMPDDALIGAAEADQLTSRAQIAAQVERMLADPKARGVVATFHDQWLRIADIDGVQKDTAVFPSFTAPMAALMKQEAQKFLDYVVWEGSGTLSGMLSTPATFVNGSLASYYGMSGVTGDAFVKVDLDPKERAGFLTQGGLLSLLAKTNQTSPVQRGKFVREQLLCTELPPPPPGIVIKPPELSATLTTRQRFSQHATSATCAGCHHLMDPIGLGFEGFDGAGRGRPMENGVPVDSSGNVLESDVAGPFNGAIELQAKLASSKQVEDCATRKWFRYAYGRGETEKDGCSLDTLQKRFAGGGYKIRDLLAALTETDAFLYRRALPAAGGTQ